MIEYNLPIILSSNIYWCLQRFGSGLSSWITSMLNMLGDSNDNWMLLSAFRMLRIIQYRSENGEKIRWFDWFKTDVFIVIEKLQLLVKSCNQKKWF